MLRENHYTFSFPHKASPTKFALLEDEKKGKEVRMLES